MGENIDPELWARLKKALEDGPAGPAGEVEPSGVVQHARTEVARFEAQAWCLIAAMQRARAAKAADLLRAGDVVGALAELEALARLPPAPEGETASDVTENDLRLLRHMVGVTGRDRRGWCRHRVAVTGAADIEAMKRLEVAGLVKRGAPYLSTDFFHATDAGLNRLGFGLGLRPRGALSGCSGRPRDVVVLDVGLMFGRGWSQKDIAAAMLALKRSGATDVTSYVGSDRPTHVGEARVKGAALPTRLSFLLNGLTYTILLKSERPSGRGWLSRWLTRILDECHAVSTGGEP